MSQTSAHPMGSREEIADTLREKAEQLWGRERAAAIMSTIEKTADVVWQISQDPPPPDEEPGFYF